MTLIPASGKKPPHSVTVLLFKADGHGMRYMFGWWHETKEVFISRTKEVHPTHWALLPDDNEREVVTLATSDDWIDADDTKPPKMQMVFTWNANGSGVRHGSAFWSGKRWEAYGKVKEVTHWMPIPKGPINEK